jgi:hypothetical protein
MASRLMRCSAGCRDIFRMLPPAGKQKRSYRMRCGMALVDRIGFRRSAFLPVGNSMICRTRSIGRRALRGHQRPVAGREICSDERLVFPAQESLTNVSPVSGRLEDCLMPARSRRCPMTRRSVPRGLRRPRRKATRSCRISSSTRFEAKCLPRATRWPPTRSSWLALLRQLPARWAAANPVVERPSNRATC